MSKRNKILIQGIVLIAIISAVLLINGCGKQSPLSPTSNNTDMKQAFGPDNVETQWGRVFSMGSGGLAGISADPNSTDTLDTSVLGYESEFIVPAGAVDAQVQITCTPQNYFTQYGMVYVYDFGPDGLTFNQPAILTLDLDALEDYNPTDTDFNRVELRLYDEASRTWQLIEVDTDLSDGVVEFEIDHFSRYGIGGRTL
ncbi:MAG: hypothetical protein GF307_03780 [candidate division Zixibacteria bacterium]|nr:hypothetical protein [candidate division Zixibacteria bacterium]